MQSIAAELQLLISKHLEALHDITPEEFSHKPAAGKWSKQEILGHLVDSAQNNIRRFILAQYEESPQIVYNQDKWVAICGYQQYPSSELIELWYLLNKHIAQILDNASDDMSQRIVRTSESHTVEWLARDYIVHLRHHLHQVLELEPVPYS